MRARKEAARGRRPRSFPTIRARALTQTRFCVITAGVLEALDLLQALNTGHDGSLSTVHANSPEDALRRLETLALMAGVGLPHQAVRDQVASALDLVVHQARRADGSRAVVSICQVVRGPGGAATRELLHGDRVDRPRDGVLARRLEAVGG